MISAALAVASVEHCTGQLHGSDCIVRLPDLSACRSLLCPARPTVRWFRQVPLRGGMAHGDSDTTGEGPLHSVHALYCVVAVTLTSLLRKAGSEGR